MGEDLLLRARCSAAVAGLYEIEAEIGRGGMAVVYRALDIRLRRKVALKVLPPELAFRPEVRTRFLREAEMSARLSHPNIVPIYAVAEAEGIVYFTVGLVEGESLAARLAREPRPPLEMVRRILSDVAEALQYAHQVGVIHRDIKPDNILIDAATGRSLVTDFGIARAAEGDQRLTVTGIAVGTPAYMSPEQAMGEREVDGRADIYALGVVGYQLLAGELPFQATNTPSMLMKHLSERPRPLAQLRRDLPDNLVRAIDRALAKGRDDRWPDAAAFRFGLASDGPWVTPVATPPASFSPPQSSSHPSHPATVGTIQGRREEGRDALNRWREEQGRWKDAVRGRRAARERQPYELQRQSPEERIARVRRRFTGSAGTILMLAAINAVFTPGLHWWIVPAIVMGFGAVRSLSDLWADGIPLRDVFRRPARRAFSGEEQPLRLIDARIPAPVTATEAVLESVPHEVLDGRQGARLRDAFAARAQIRSVLARLGESERSMLPEIQPTVESLVERVRTLATALHALESEASPDAIVRLQGRITEANQLPPDAPERDRKLELLERQLKTLTELAQRRTILADQMERALLVLETMSLDLMRLRNAGIAARLHDQGPLTQEMQALARDVQRVAEAVDETRRET